MTHKNFTFPDYDKDGLETLTAIEDAHRFNTWMYQTIRPFCKGKILEIGSGIGNISTLFINENADITLSDIRQLYCNILTQKFQKETLNLNLIDSDFDNKFRHLFNSFDTVFALNVIEHIDDHEMAIRNCHKLLKNGGHLVILVPAYPMLYNTFDKNLEHYRRYTKKTLKKLINDAGFSILHDQYFNAAGITGWIVSGSILKHNTIPAGQMKLYDTLVPIFRWLDKCLLNQVGLSVISVGMKS